MKINTIVKKKLADVYTPVSVYLNLRKVFSRSVLLESNDFASLENCRSFIGLDPIAGFVVVDGIVYLHHFDGSVEDIEAPNVGDVSDHFRKFLQSIEVDGELPKSMINGLFGHTNFEAVQYFDSLKFNPDKKKIRIPDMQYWVYRHIIGFDHFKDELFLIENIPDGQPSQMKTIEALIDLHTTEMPSFKIEGEETSNLSDQQFKDLVTAGRHHCQIGDVFQIVFSRQFQQKYVGDDFSVYRVLRSVNPSPYLFYFDFDGYRLFGSSPEAQMIIKDNVATVNPIAGTYRRTGNDKEDAQKAKELTEDPKETAEHIMLVDLARNDLGRHSTAVEVKDLMNIEYFSHVIHLVSRVDGQLEDDTNPITVFGDTFPAGTLSGAPKYKAIELIDQYENQNRSFYGGGIGFIDFNGEMNQAILIRSFLSKDDTLHYQAGAGIVAASQEESELQEVNNKLGALKKALQEAERMANL
ncbi:MAG: chorismate-binding protein [Bacteroidia bacterium]|nr:chorismate-binding protein [Bacteroidia bacterium]